MSNDAIPPVDEISPASKEGHDWVVNIEALLDEIKEIPRPEEPEIKNIPSIHGNWKCSNDFLPKTIRWQFVAFMKQSFNLNVHSFFEQLQEKEDDVWRCYDGVDEQFIAENRERFIKNLLANSCLLIFAMVILNQDSYRKLYKFFYKCNYSTNQQRIDQSKYLENIIFGKRVEIQRYMLTMDSQIPFFVLEAVYTYHSNLSSVLNTPIHKLAISCFKGINPGVHKSKLHSTDSPQYGFQHLLHIFHWYQTPKEKFHKINAWFPMDNFYIPSATGLQLSGTVFKRHAAYGIDVSFHDAILCGVMQLPNGSHFQYRDDIYKQLLAFERVYGMVCGFAVTAHIACILCMAKTEEDVKLLRAKHIFPRIDDNKAVLRSLKRYKTRVLSKDIPTSVDLYNLMKDVMSHHEKDSSTKKYYVDFKGRYCSNPWITISVVGGILLFFLTFIQTIYSALSYNKQ